MGPLFYGKSGIKSISYFCHYVVHLTACYVFDLIYCDTVASVSCIILSSMNSVYVGTRVKSVYFKSLNNLIAVYYEVTVQNGSSSLLIQNMRILRFFLQYFSWKLSSNTKNGIEIQVLNTLLFWIWKLVCSTILLSRTSVRN